MLVAFKVTVSGYPNFRLYLDIQDPVTFTRAAALIKKHNLNDRVFLTFFAKKAIDSTKYKYTDGANMCYQYAVDHGLSGLNIITQINGGELTFTNGQAFPSIFQAQIKVTDYLSCWSAAQQGCGLKAARMPQVAASVPAGNNVAYYAVAEVVSWGKTHGRKTITIVPNSDQGRKAGNTCQSTAVSAVTFNKAAREAKAAFLRSKQTDYVVFDIVGDLANRK